MKIMLRNILIYIQIIICICLLYGIILDQLNENDLPKYYINDYLFIHQKISWFTFVSIIVFMVYNYCINNDYLLVKFINECYKENETNIITLFAIPYDEGILYKIIRNRIFFYTIN